MDDWEPPPGMTKVACGKCGKQFATRGPDTCPDCKVGTLFRDARRKNRGSLSFSPFDPQGSGGSSGFKQVKRLSK